MYGSKATRGKYTPKYPEKYRGDVRNIVYRSSYELKAFNWCDTRSNITEWSSEEVIIPYKSPIDGRTHRYFMDLKFVVVSTDGTRTTYLAEIKPEKFTKPPPKPSRKTAKYIAEVCQWGVNQAKWNATVEYCLDRGWKFVILTEKHLNIKR